MTREEHWRCDACGARIDIEDRADSRCWSAKSGRMRTRYAIHYMTAPTEPRAFAEVRKPSCYRQSALVFYDKLPDFVKLKDVVRKEKKR